MSNKRLFEYTGISHSYANAESYMFESKNWIVTINTDSLIRKDYIIHGEIEGKQRYFEFNIDNNGWLIVWGVFKDSMTDGLNKRYEGDEIPLPNYVKEFILSHDKETLSKLEVE
jgi:hypothetical protein